MTVSLVVISKVLDLSLYNRISKYAPVFNFILCFCEKTDKSIKKNGIKIVDIKFENNFSALRNFALSNVTTDWVFFLDSDEEISDELLINIPALLNIKNVDGFWFSRKTFIDDKYYLHYGLFYPDFQLRLFRNKSNYIYTGKVHEKVSIPHGKTKELKLDILHHPSHPKYTKLSDLKNFSQYIEIESNELIANKTNPIYLFAMGLTKGFIIFLSGFLRGKGYLDGWAGFRAHFIFANYLSAVYFKACYKYLFDKR